MTEVVMLECDCCGHMQRKGEEASGSPYEVVTWKFPEGGASGRAWGMCPHLCGRCSIAMREALARAWRLRMETVTEAK